MKRLTIPSGLRTQLMRSREQLQSAYSDLVEASNQIADCEQQIERLVRDISSTEERISLEDAKGLARLETKRVKVDLAQSRLAKLQPSLPAKQTAVANALRGIKPSMSLALRPAYESFLGEAAKTLRPYYRSELDARKAAQGTPAANEFLGFVHQDWRWGEDGDISGAVEAALAALDKVIKGENPWSFKQHS